jgi:hypothetical protein
MMEAFRAISLSLIGGIFLISIAHAKKGPREDDLSHGQEPSIAAPAARGKVVRLLINPFGEVDGVLLHTDVVVSFPKHMSERLAAVAEPGDLVEVRGYAEAPGQIKGFVIRGLDSGKSLVVQPKPRGGPGALPGHSPRAALQPLSAEGEITHLLYGRRGEINGFILGEGTIVRLAHEAADRFREILKIGQRISASGYGTKNDYGEAFEATALGPAGQEAQPVLRGQAR